MVSLKQIPTWSRLALVAAQLWCILSLALLVLTDLMSPQAKAFSDFHTSFYVAGYAVLNGQALHLYPPTDGAVKGAYFDELTRRLIPNIPPQLVACFMYSPLVAVIFAPFALLLPQYGLLIWQALSVASLVVITTDLEKVRPRAGWRVFFAAFAFLPVFATLWIGQLGLCFGLLPLWLGYKELRAGNEMKAGILWSLLLLKPQLYPVAALIGFIFGITGQLRCLKGLAIGSAVILSIFALCLGPNVFVSWLHSLTSSEALLSGTAVNSPGNLVACLPGAIFMALPDSLRPAAKLPVYTIAFGIILLMLWHLRKICRSALELREKQALVVLLSILFLPVVSPRLLLYDLCIYVLCGIMVFVTEHDLLFKYSRLCIAGWLFINIYIASVVVMKAPGNSLILALGLAALNACAVVLALKRVRQGG